QGHVRRARQARSCEQACLRGVDGNDNEQGCGGCWPLGSAPRRRSGARGEGPAVSTKDVRRYRENYQDEVDSGTLYRELANLEPSPELADVYRQLAQTEDRHAQFWAQKLRERGVAVPPAQLSRRARILRWLGRRL